MADSKNIDDGGLAFPGKRWQQVGTVADFGFSDDDSPTFDHVSHPGMSLRDWFAGRAMQGQLSGFWQSEEPHGWSDEEIAAEAYRIADAMISARKAGA